ncbi:MAG: sugar nucleotide-binding protein [Terrimicrobiaceae bacterium]
MILLLGGNGYVGAAFARVLAANNLPFAAPSHQELDALNPDELVAAVRDLRPRFAINAVGFTGRPNIDGTENEKIRCLRVNSHLPGVLAEVFASEGVRWGHVSSGCIYEGCRPDGLPFTEEDLPNFAFGDPRSSWYAKTKAMAETLLLEAPGCLVWRMRIPFDEFDHERNYLSKLMAYEKLLEVRGSISQRQEFAAAALASLINEIPAGIYNVTNPGAISTTEVVEAIQRHGLTTKPFTFFQDEADFMAAPGRVRRASCELSSAKLAAAGIPLREIHDSLEETLRHWVPAVT